MRAARRSVIIRTGEFLPQENYDAPRCVRQLRDKRNNAAEKSSINHRSVLNRPECASIRRVRNDYKLMSAGHSVLIASDPAPLRLSLLSLAITFSSLL